MAENFPKLMTDTKLQIQEFQRPLTRINAKNKTKQNPTPIHIIFKLWKTKDKENLARSQGEKNTLPIDNNDTELFFFRNYARREWIEIFKMWKEKTH